MRSERAKQILAKAKQDADEADRQERLQEMQRALLRPLFEGFVSTRTRREMREDRE